MKTRASQPRNPLYEKLCSRFSYSGKTVGEMMLTRAHALSSTTKTKGAAVSSLTAEASITRANSLPRVGGAVACPARRTPLRLSPAAILAFFLLAAIVSFLLISCLTNLIGTVEPSLSTLAQPSGAQLYEESVDLLLRG